MIAFFLYSCHNRSRYIHELWENSTICFELLNNHAVNGGIYYGK